MNAHGTSFPFRYIESDELTALLDMLHDNKLNGNTKIAMEKVSRERWMEALQQSSSGSLDKKRKEERIPLTPSSSTEFSTMIIIKEL